MKKALFGLFSLLFALSISLVATGVNEFNYLSSETKIDHGHNELGVDFTVLDDSSASGGTPSVIPIPKIDTIAVTDAGKVFVRIDTIGKGTTAYYDIYVNSVSSFNLLIRLPSSQDTVSFLSGADIVSQSFVIQAVDGCDSLNVKNSSVYNTILPTGALTDPCKGEYTLSWNQPGGFPNNVLRYNVYADFDDGSGYVLVTSLNNRNTTTTMINGITRGKTFKFKVIAVDVLNAVNISTVLQYASPLDLATNSLVPPPTPRCTFVNADGSVQLSWLPALDTVNNFADYRIQYKKSFETNWTTFVPLLGQFSLSDNVQIITGINAQLEQYDFRITSLAGCDGSQFMSYDSISSIFLSAVQRRLDISKRVDLSWNASGPNYDANTFFNLFKSIDSSSFSFIGSAFSGGIFKDNTNKSICNSNLNYYISFTDSAFVSQGFSCQAKSSVASVGVVDTLVPKGVEIQVVSYDLVSGGLNIFWNGIDTAGIDTVEFYKNEGTQSGLPVLRLVASSPVVNSLPAGGINQLHIPFNILDARSESVTIESIVRDVCYFYSNGLSQPHQTITMNVGWLVKDSINKLSWNKYIGFNESFDVEYEVFHSTSQLGPWISNGSVGVNRTYEHKVPNGNAIYYYHVKARSKDTLSPSYAISNSNIGLVYSAFIDTTIDIAKQSLKSRLKLFPNPTKEKMELTYSGSKHLYFDVYNSSGEIVNLPIKILPNRYLFNTSKLSNGVYFLKVHSGQELRTFTFIKQ